MQKIMLFLNAKDRLGRKAFQDWYLDVQAPSLVEAAPRLHGCTANICDVELERDGASSKGVLPRGDLRFDVVTELWLDSADDYPRLLDGHFGVLAKELHEWADRPAAYLVNEYVRIDQQRPVPLRQRTPGVKFIPIVSWRPDISEAEARLRWLDHTVIVRWAHPLCERYVHNYVDAALTDDPPIAGHFGVGVLHYPSVDAYRTGHYRDEEACHAVAVDISHFMETLISPLFASEYVFKDIRQRFA